MEMTKIYWNLNDLVNASKVIDCYSYVKRNTQIEDNFQSLPEFDIIDAPTKQDEKRKAEAIRAFVQSRSSICNHVQVAEEGERTTGVYQEDEK